MIKEKNIKFIFHNLSRMFAKFCGASTKNALFQLYFYRLVFNQSIYMFCLLQ